MCVAGLSFCKPHSGCQHSWQRVLLTMQLPYLPCTLLNHAPPPTCLLTLTPWPCPCRGAAAHPAAAGMHPGHPLPASAAQGQEQQQRAPQVVLGPGGARHGRGALQALCVCDAGAPAAPPHIHRPAGSAGEGEWGVQGGSSNVAKARWQACQPWVLQALWWIHGQRSQCGLAGAWRAPCALYAC
jgi:hypothetical protein